MASYLRVADDPEANHGRDWPWVAELRVADQVAARTTGISREEAEQRLGHLVRQIVDRRAGEPHVIHAMQAWIQEG